MDKEDKIIVHFPRTHAKYPAITGEITHVKRNGKVNVKVINTWKRILIKDIDMNELSSGPAPLVKDIKTTIDKIHWKDKVPLEIYDTKDSGLHREEKLQVDFDDPFDVPEPESVPATGGDPALATELALQALDPLTRDIVRLHYIYRVPQAAIAACYGMTQGQVSHLVIRALKVMAYHSGMPKIATGDWIAAWHGVPAGSLEARYLARVEYYLRAHGSQSVACLAAGCSQGCMRTAALHIATHGPRMGLPDAICKAVRYCLDHQGGYLSYVYDMGHRGMDKVQGSGRKAVRSAQGKSPHS